MTSIKTKYLLETERLRLREFNLGDTAFIVELVNSEGWLKYIGDRKIHTKEQAEMYLLNGPLKSYREHGFGLSMVEQKADGRPVGMCGIIKRVNLENPDIGFAFLPEYTGKGFAFEIAGATVKYAQERLKISPLFAITLAQNARSINLLEKMGFSFSRIVHFKETNEDLMLFINEMK